MALRMFIGQILVLRGGWGVEEKRYLSGYLNEKSCTEANSFRLNYYFFVVVNECLMFSSLHCHHLTMSSHSSMQFPLHHHT